MSVKDHRGQPPRPDHPFASGPRIIFGQRPPVPAKKPPAPGNDKDIKEPQQPAPGNDDDIKASRDL